MNYENTNKWIALIAVVAVALSLFSVFTVNKKVSGIKKTTDALSEILSINGNGELLSGGETGDKLIEQYFSYVRFNEGIKTAFDFFASSTIHAASTTVDEIRSGRLPIKQTWYADTCTDATSTIFAIENPYTSSSTVDVARINVTTAASTTGDGTGVAIEFSVGTSSVPTVTDIGLNSGGLVDAFVSASGTIGIIENNLGSYEAGFINTDHAPKSDGNLKIILAPKGTPGSWLLGEATTSIREVQEAGLLVNSGTNDGILDSGNTFDCKWAVHLYGF